MVTAQHTDREVTASVFERLHGSYGSELLDTTWRMNDGVCQVVSEAFYGGRLVPHPSVAARRMAFARGGALDEVLDPERPVVWARVDHLQPGMRSTEEASLCADLVHELVHRHGVPRREIAVLAPFRAQVRAIRSALQRAGLGGEDEPVVDTVERLQGQEREVVVVSLAVGDPGTLAARASFFFSTNRLNVALVTCADQGRARRVGGGVSCAARGRRRVARGVDLQAARAGAAAGRPDRGVRART